MVDTRPDLTSNLESRLLAQRLVKLERMVRDLGGASQAADRSVENGAIEVYDDDDNLKVSLGRKKRGKWGAGYVGTDQPPKPTVPDVLSMAGALLVFWDGSLEEATDIPLDRVAFYASERSGFHIDDDDVIEAGAIYSEEGGTAVIPTWGEDTIYIRAVAISENEVFSNPTIQIAGESAESLIDFYYDEFTLTEAGSQDLILTFEPIDFSEHVYWHVGGADGAGLFQQDLVTWTRIGQTLTLTGEPVEAAVGDVVMVKYAYFIGQPAGTRIVAKIVSADKDEDWTVVLLWTDDDGDEHSVGINHVNDAGPWDPQEIGYLTLADIVLRLTTPNGTWDYLTTGHVERDAISGEDDEGTYAGHRYTLTDDGWHDDLQTLPPVSQIMVSTGQATAAGAGGFAPGGSEYGRHGTGRPEYRLTRAIFNNSPPLYDRAECWDCTWDHAHSGDAGSVYWNNPPSDPFWAGSGVCEALYATALGGGWVNSSPVGWKAETYSSGGLTQTAVGTTTLAVWMNYANVVAAHFTDPAAGHTPPTPPPGHTIEWEYPTAEVASVEAAITEALGNVATNVGTIYAEKWPGTGFGPYEADVLQWYMGGYSPRPTLMGPYGGGAGAWHNITAQVETSGKTWILLLSDVLHVQATKHNSGRVPGDFVGEYRTNLNVAFRFNLNARRYRFVPAIPGTMEIDVKAYTDPDEV